MNMANSQTSPYHYPILLYKYISIAIQTLDLHALPLISYTQFTEKGLLSAVHSYYSLLFVASLWYCRTQEELIRSCYPF